MNAAGIVFDDWFLRFMRSRARAPEAVMVDLR